MTRILARLVLAMLTLPVCGVALVVGALAIAAVFQNTNTNPPAYAGVVIWSAVYIVLVPYWIVVWSGLVRWTPRRAALTVAAMLVALGAGTAFGGTIALVGGPPGFLCVMLGGGVPPIVWVLLTVFIWRETNAERAARLGGSGAGAICCPLCGYSMAGLHGADCPECGARFTIEQLLAAQESREGATLPSS